MNEENDKKSNILQTLTSPLPQTGLKGIKNIQIDEVKEFLQQTLPESERNDIEMGLNWHLHLDQQLKSNKVTKKHKNKKKKFSNNFNKLPRDGWRYDKLIEMNSKWKEYVLSVFNSQYESDFSKFSSIFNKLELIGSQIKVIRSNIVSYVGITGIVVMETKYTLQVVNNITFKLKVLLKENCVFEVFLNKWKFVIFGKHILIRPQDRSVKKIKFYSLSDI